MPNTHSLELERDSSQYAGITDAAQTGLDLTGDLTFELWVKIENASTSGQDYGLVTKDQGANRSFNFTYFNSGGTPGLFVDFHKGDGNINSINHTVTLPAGVWTHVAFVVDISQPAASQVEFFINGSSVGNGTATRDNSVTSIANSTAEFRIGNRATSYLDARVDEVRAWNDKRTAGEILDNKDKELVGDEAGLVGYWQFNNDYLDQTSNDNDLTPSGSPVFSTDVPFRAAIGNMFLVM